MNVALFVLFCRFGRVECSFVVVVFLLLFLQGCHFYLMGWDGMGRDRLALLSEGVIY